MNSAELFYVIGEYVDDEKYCRRKGLHPHRTIEKTLDGKLRPVVVEYTKGNEIYVALSAGQCYSGYAVTLMKLPELPFEELLHVALSAKRVADRAGALGIILKKYETAFEQYLLGVSQSTHLNSEQEKKIAVVATFICDFIRENTSFIWDMQKILFLCEELKARYSNALPKSKWIRLFRYGI